MLDLSIIIVTYNKVELLKQCLESIYDNMAQTLNYEIIVIDNNSKDYTLQVLQEQFPYVKIIENDTNVGFARANNQGMRMAKGKYLLLLNNDTFVLSGAVEKMITFMKENLTVGAIGPALVNADGRTVQAQGSGRGDKFWLSSRPVQTSFITGAAIMIRNELLDDVGEMDEEFFFYNEDLDWCRRMIAKNWKIYYLPQAKIIHYGGQSTALINEKAIVEGFRGGLYFCSKYCRAFFPLYRLLLFVFLVLQIVWQLFLIIIWPGKGRSFRKLKGYFILLGIDLFWKHSQKKMRQKLFGGKG